MSLVLRMIHLNFGLERLDGLLLVTIIRVLLLESRLLRLSGRMLFVVFWIGASMCSSSRLLTSLGNQSALDLMVLLRTRLTGVLGTQIDRRSTLLLARERESDLLR